MSANSSLRLIVHREEQIGEHNAETYLVAHLPIPEEEPELPGDIHNTLSSFDEKLDLEYDCDDLIQNPMLMVPKQYGRFMDIGMYDSLYND